MPAPTPPTDPLVDLVAEPVRYPVWLGVTSFLWAVAGWMLALHAPAMAFWPMVETIHVVLPSVTGVLILLNLRYALRAVWRGTRVDALMLVTALQIGLFTTLFHQIAAHQGAEHFKLTGPTTPGQWVQFSLAHALKATDVLDTIEAYGLNVQVIKHDGPFVATLLVAYHVVVDVFVLGVLWALVGVVKRKLLSDPGAVGVFRAGLMFGAVVFLLLWLLLATYLRPWRPIDIPLWLAENVVRVLDFSDAMDSYDIHWHQVPKEWQESTLTFLCRVWITIGLGALANRREKAVSAELPSIRRLAGAGLCLGLFGIFVGLPGVLPADRPAHSTALADVLPSPQAPAALAALRRMGPHARDAVPRLAARLDTGDREERLRIAAVLGCLGPDALPQLTRLAGDAEAGCALAAADGLARIGPEAAPALVNVWHRTPHDAVRIRAAEALADLGPDAVPPLVAALRPDNSAECHHWIESLDRNWLLRASANETFRAVAAVCRCRERGAAPADADVRAAGTVALAEWLDRTRSPKAAERAAAIAALAALGRAAADAVPAVRERLGDDSPAVQRAAAETLGKIAPPERATLTALVRARLAVDSGVRSAAAQSLWALDRAWVRSAAVVDCRRELVAAARHPAVGVRVAALTVLRDSTLNDHDTLAAFAVAASDADPEVRQLARAAIAGRDPNWPLVADRQPELVGELLAAIASSLSESRQAAVAILDRINPSWPDELAARVPIVPLIELAKSPDRQAALEASNVLGRIGVSARDAVPSLILLLARPEPALREAATRALDRIDPGWPTSEATVAAVTDLAKALASTTPDGFASAAGVLAGLGSRASAAAPELVAAARYGSERWRSARDALDRVTPGWRTTAAATTAAKLIETRLAVPDPAARGRAADELAELSEKSAPAVTSLVLATADESADVRAAALAALRRIDAEWVKSSAARNAVPELVKAIRYGPGAAALHPRLSKSLTPSVPPPVVSVEPNPHEAVRALARLGPLAAEAVPTLLKAIPRESRFVGPLAGFGSPDALREPDLVLALDAVDTNWPKSQQAKELLPELLDRFAIPSPALEKIAPHCLPELLAHLDRCDKALRRNLLAAAHDRDVVIGRSVIQLLAKHGAGQDNVRRALEAVADKGSLHLRLEAKEALRPLKPKK